MFDDVVELLLTEAALDKLGARTISAEEVAQLLRNIHVVVRNPRAPGRWQPSVVGRPHERRALHHAGDRADSRTHDLAYDHRLGVH